MAHAKVAATAPIGYSPVTGVSDCRCPGSEWKLIDYANGRCEKRSKWFLRSISVDIARWGHLRAGWSRVGLSPFDVRVSKVTECGNEPGSMTTMTPPRDVNRLGRPREEKKRNRGAKELVNRNAGISFPKHKPESFPIDSSSGFAAEEVQESQKVTTGSAPKPEGERYFAGGSGAVKGGNLKEVFRERSGPEQLPFVESLSADL
ncbi:hypothetical protein WN55_06568 [Dufourea novaeangliae]|uniref:Uncharacterized protein n=1 Tax=Dufourea novaeangliae TaxID=178035 RepID=A0A154PSI3_DUFNO|nr:hypothetical protein WN55_06568 [Dufourea novaeangliae]